MFAGCTAPVLDLGATKVRPDAGQLADSGDYWTLERKEASLEIRGFFYAGSTAYVRVLMYPYHTCEHGGPVDVEDRGGGLIRVSAYVWLHHAAAAGVEPCGFITDRVERDVPLPDLAPGRYKVADPLSGNEVDLTIVAPPNCSTSGTDCNLDCDCGFGVECVAPGGPNGVGRCGIPCTPVKTGCCGQIQPHVDLECPPEMFCEDLLLATGICKSHASDPCYSDDECPSGMFCPVTDVPRGCMWKVELNARVRHECSSSSDCDAGLVCVERDSRRSCEIPCFTNRSTCPFMHACSASEGWICGWLGE